MLTTKDINNILTADEKLFNRGMDDKLRPLNGQFADFRREFREFKQEMYEFKQEMYEFKGDMTEFRDQTQKILENIFDDLQGKYETEKQRGQHLPAFKTLS